MAKKKEDAEKSVRRIQVGVAKSVQHLDGIQRGAKTWWCGDAEAKPGDLIAVYKRLYGVAWVLEVLGVRYDGADLCELHDMLTVDVRVLKVASKPVSFHSMKQDETLGRMVAVRKNFQGSLFPMTEEELRSLLALMDG